MFSLQALELPKDNSKDDPMIENLGAMLNVSVLKLNEDWR
jgi:hypothetical protein